MQENYNILLDLIKKTRFLNEVSDVEDDKMYQVIRNLNENDINDLSGITKIGAGSYSTVYKIKDKVLKIGLAKSNENIFESKNIVPCLLKINLGMQTKFGKMVFGIEIQELVQMEKDKTNECLFKIYENLRNEQLIWTDVKESNVGYYNGDFVIVDTDSIYRENDENIYWFTKTAKEFEKIYQSKKGRIGL